ncbi:MAG TPA: hypothetical protein VFA89_09600 [Terriglobales bacterium]|nr:hypothetical protein [Terriglobales bacterium]
MRFTFLAVVGAVLPLCVLLLSQTSQAQTLTCNYTFFAVNNNGAKPTTASGINSSDTIVGGWFTATENDAAFLRKANGSMSTFSYPGFPTTFFSGINDNGAIVGAFGRHQAFTDHGFLLQGGKLTPINYPASIQTVPSGINNNGAIVGTHWQSEVDSSGFSLMNGAYTDVRYPNASATSANAINNLGGIVGDFIDNQQPVPHIHGFILTNGQFQQVDAPGNNYNTTLTGINDQGIVTGWYQQTTDSGGIGFEYVNGTFKTLVIPNATSVSASGINSLGDITGVAVNGKQQLGFLGKNCH